MSHSTTNKYFGYQRDKIVWLGSFKTADITNWELLKSYLDEAQVDGQLREYLFLAHFFYEVTLPLIVDISIYPPLLFLCI